MDYWQEYAACKGRENLFFTTQRGQASNYDREAAIRICSRCPVKEECLSYAESNCEEHGIWGGKDFSEHSTTRVAAFRERQKYYS